MRRPFKWDKKYLYWGITAFCVIACAVLFYMALNYLPVLGRALAALVKILSPFIWGLVITYLLSPFMKLVERGVFKPLAEERRQPLCPRDVRHSLGDSDAGRHRGPGLSHHPPDIPEP